MKIEKLQEKFEEIAYNWHCAKNINKNLVSKLDLIAKDDKGNYAWKNTYYMWVGFNMHYGLIKTPNQNTLAVIANENTVYPSAEELYKELLKVIYEVDNR